MAKELKFDSPSFGERIKGMLGVDFYRLFHTPLFYIFLAIAAIIPAMILGTSGMENPQTGQVAEKLYTNVWHIIAAEKPLYVVGSIAEYANMNMVFIFGGIMVSIFIGHDYKSGYVKQLFTTHAKKQALKGLDMKVPVGAIYGFIGENGSGKSTTEKIICGLLHQTDGSVKIFGKEQTDAHVRAKMGVLIEAPGCFPNYSVWNNMMLQAANLGIKNAEQEVVKVLKMVRMEGAASNKYKNCSLGMKQRIGIAMALLGNPTLLVLDEPINGLDADGMRIMREIFFDLAEN